LTCGAKASARPDFLPRRPRLISPTNNSDGALSFTSMFVIMPMWCNASQSTSGCSNPVMVRGFPNL
ncbi:MAG: hypothetical protein ACKPKO_18480, partial [Candidatus Fonsibacter sp.]